MSWQGDWADWAGDNPVEAERELREEARKRLEREVAELKAIVAQNPNPKTPEELLADLVKGTCGHTEVYATGHCADCGHEVEGFEPTDAQIFAHHGQTKETAA
jgi:hypothetical protein